MGNQLSGYSPTQISQPEYYISSLAPDLSIGPVISKARFMKAVRAYVKESGAPVLVKYFVIPQSEEGRNLPVSEYVNLAKEISSKLSKCPNCLPHIRVVQSQFAAVQVRQWMSQTLADRISTRPFLQLIEMKWIAFQLLKALDSCHKLSVCHGDLNLSNVLVSSWLWASIADFAPHKPVLLPTNNPADFQFFFDPDSGVKRRLEVCTVAPERFYDVITASAVAALPSLSSGFGSGPGSHFGSQIPRSGSQVMLHRAAGGGGARDSPLAFEASPAAGDLHSSSSSPHPEAMMAAGQRADTPTPSVRAERESTYSQFLTAAPKADLTPAMDVFSLGCVLAELFTEGSAPFTYAQLLDFKRDRYSPEELLRERIRGLGLVDADEAIVDMVLKMLNRIPDLRGSCEEHLQEQYGRVFPTCFYDFLHIYLEQFAAPLPASADTHRVADYRVLKLRADLPHIVKELACDRSAHPARNEPLVLVLALVASHARHCRLLDAKLAALALLGDLSEYLSPELILDRVLSLLLHTKEDRFSALTLSYARGDERAAAAGASAASSAASQRPPLLHSIDDPNPLVRAATIRTLVRVLQLCYRKCAPLVQQSPISEQQKQEPQQEQGLQEPQTLATTSSSSPSSLVTAQEEETVGRMIPTSENNIFPDYIFPLLEPLARDRSALVRITLAQHMGTLAEISQRFLEHFFSNELNSNPPSLQAVSNAYVLKQKLQPVLRDCVHRLLQPLLVDAEYQVRVAVVERQEELAKLCLFFGPMRTCDVILSHTITFFNEPSWRLREQFCRSLPLIVCTVGRHSFDTVRPLLENALCDTDERVICAALGALVELLRLGLVPKKHVRNSLPLLVAPLTLHCNAGIRSGAIAYMCTLAKQLEPVDVELWFLPKLHRYLQNSLAADGLMDLRDPSELHLALRPPLPRIFLDLLIRFSLLDHLLEKLRPKHYKRSESSASVLASSNSTTEQLVDLFLKKLYSLGLQENPDERTIMLMESGLRNLREARARAYGRMTSGTLQPLPAGAPQAQQQVSLVSVIEPQFVESVPVPCLNDPELDQVALEAALALGFGLGYGFEVGGQSGPRALAGVGGGRGAGAGASAATSPAMMPLAPSPAVAIARLQQCVFVLEPAGVQELQPRVQELLGRQLASAIVSRTAASTTSGVGMAGGLQQLSPGSVHSLDEHDANGNGNGASASAAEGFQASLTLARSTHTVAAGAAADNNPQPNPEWRFMFGGDEEEQANSSESLSRTAHERAMAEQREASSPSSSMRSFMHVGDSHSSANGCWPAANRVPECKKKAARFVEEARAELAMLTRQQRLAGAAFSASTTTAGGTRETSAGVGLGPGPGPVRPQGLSSLNECTEVPNGWRPQGLLCASFREHSGAVTRIAMHPSDKFFASASDDGTIRLWCIGQTDYLLLPNRSKQVFAGFTQQKIKSVDFCTSGHDYLLCHTYDSSILLLAHGLSANSGAGTGATLSSFTASTSGTQQQPPQYVVRRFENPSQEYGHLMDLRVVSDPARNRFVAATTAGFLLGYDLRCPRPVFTLRNDLHNGLLTCLDVEPHYDGLWCAVGTSHASVLLWDLRTHLQFAQLSYTPPKPSLQSPFVKCVKMNRCDRSGERGVIGTLGTLNSIVVWSLSTRQMQQVYSITGPSSKKASATVCALWSAYSAPVGATPGQQFLLSGGTDRAIRLWEMNRVSESLVVTPPVFTSTSTSSFGATAIATAGAGVQSQESGRAAAAGSLSFGAPSATAGGLYGNQTRAVSLVQRPVLSERQEAGVEYAEEQTPPAAFAGATRVPVGPSAGTSGSVGTQQLQMHPAAPVTHSDSITALALARPSNHHTQVFVISSSADGVLNIWK